MHAYVKEHKPENARLAKYLSENFNILTVIDPKVTLQYNEAEMTMEGHPSEEGNNAFDQEFSLKVKGGHSLQETVTLELKDGDKVFGETKMKLQTLLNGQTIVPSQCKDIEHLKKLYAEKRDNWYPLFHGDVHKGQIKLQTSFVAEHQWLPKNDLFQGGTKWGWIFCGVATFAAAAGGTTYAIMDS